jgi:hypothetical protein
LLPSGLSASVAGQRDRWAGDALGLGCAQQLVLGCSAWCWARP